MRPKSGDFGYSVCNVRGDAALFRDPGSPAIDLKSALAMTVPGIVAHQSALKNGEQLRVPQFA